MEDTNIKLARTMMEDQVKIAKSFNRNVRGRIDIDPEREGVIILCFSAYPSGDFICWFLEMGTFYFFGLVNEKLREVITIPAHEISMLQREIDLLKEELESQNE